MAATAYDRKFFSVQADGSYQSASVVVPILKRLMPDVRSVCDVGCGVGTWLRVWKENGAAEVLGLDGDYVDPAQLQIPDESFRPTNLSESFHVGRRFDLAMSLEVAEHLPRARAESFVEDLTSLAPVILFSAAVPKQTGIGHVNEQWQGAWAKLFMQRGYQVLDVLRAEIWDNPAVKVWYRQNMLIFAVPEAVERYPALSERSEAPLSVIHPDLFVARPTGIDTRELARLLWRRVSTKILSLRP